MGRTTVVSTLGIVALGFAAAAVVGCSASPSTAARDLSLGGVCDAGESVTISTDGASPVVEGDCGTVTVTASGVTGNIAAAETVEIRGAGSSILGEQWGTVAVAAPDTGLGVDHIRVLRIEPGADGPRVTGRTHGEVTVAGASATVNTERIRTLVVAGDRSTVVVSGPVGELAVRGDDNSITWTGGAAGPDSDTGTGNTYNY